MRQPYKEKFLSDVDGDGMPIPNHLPFAVLNIGKLPNVQVAQGLLADTRCLNCPPAEHKPTITWADENPHTTTVEEKKAVAEHLLHGAVYVTCPPVPAGKSWVNPKGWDEVDGVKLPPINWADLTKEQKMFVAIHDHLHDVVQAAQTNALANISTDGITILSDAEAHEAFFGWKK